MAKKIKWYIESLKYSKHLLKSANTILKFRIDSLISTVEIYFNDKTAENLHDVRIALRRVRYSMELFLVCYNKKDFMSFYNKVQILQDLSGSVRDMDITIENINSFTENTTNDDNNLVKKALEKKILLEQQFNLELVKFINGKTFKDFYKQNFSKGDRYEN
jgi:CHAD domain-containing protein